MPEHQKTTIYYLTGVVDPIDEYANSKNLRAKSSSAFPKKENEEKTREPEAAEFADLRTRRQGCPW
jgi:hypothetical protein